MKKSKLILLFSVACMIISACASGVIVVADPVVPTNTKQPEPIATNTVQVNTSTPTLAETSIPTEEPTPTTVPTETPVLTPTETLPIEWDVNPYIIEDIEGEYEGVTVKARLIIDKSLEDIVESVDVNDDIFAEAIVRSLMHVAYQRSSNSDFYNVPSYEIDRLIKIWAEAQSTGSETYWRQVQLDNIWANDLNDGSGYLEKVYNFWPMYEGTTPDDVLAMSKITIVYFDSSKSDIASAPVISGDEFGEAWGSSLDGKNFIFYTGKDMQSLVPRFANVHGVSSESATEVLLKLYAGVLAHYLIVNTDKVDLGSNGSVNVDVYNSLLKATEYILKTE